MSRQIAIIHVQFNQTVSQHQEMARFISTDAHPISDEIIFQGRINKTTDEIKGQINGVQLNMRQSVHALAHIELNAIDLAFDLIGRFVDAPLEDDFITDWMRVGADEARHFLMLADRLVELDMDYGDLPAHDGLWQAAFDTRHNLLARLSIVPLVLEARGLDVTPAMMEKFQRAGDEKSARMLSIIYEDEKTHVFAGSKWFLRLCNDDGLDPAECFGKQLKNHFGGALKPPFNIEARDEAGLPRKFYVDAV